MERLLAMLIHIGLTVIVYYGVVNAKKLCLPAAILLHMLADTFPALYQRGILPLWEVEIWAAFWTLMIMFIAAKLYKRMSEIVHWQFKHFMQAGKQSDWRRVMQPDVTKYVINCHVRLVETDAIILYNIHESHISGGPHGYCRSKEYL